MKLVALAIKTLKILYIKTFEDYMAIRKNKIGSIGTLVRKIPLKLNSFLIKETNYSSLSFLAKRNLTPTPTLTPCIEFKSKMLACLVNN